MKTKRTLKHIIACIATMTAILMNLSGCSALNKIDEEQLLRPMEKDSCVVEVRLNGEVVGDVLTTKSKLPPLFSVKLNNGRHTNCIAIMYIPMMEGNSTRQRQIGVSLCKYSRTAGGLVVTAKFTKSPVLGKCRLRLFAPGQPGGITLVDSLCEFD